MRNFFSGGVNTALMLSLVTFYVVLSSSDAIRETLVDITGSWGTKLLPAIILLSIKIGFNFASRFAVLIIVACGLAVQAAFAGMMSLWQVRWILLFNPPTSNVVFDYYFGLDDVRVAGGYLGHQVADLTLSILWRFPGVWAMDTSEVFGWGMMGLMGVMVGIICVALWFLPSGRTSHSHSRKGHGKGQRKNISVVNNF